MSKVLYIKANTTPSDRSRTFKISDSFIEEYRRNNPDDEIITLDLYKENVSVPSPEDINAIMNYEKYIGAPALKYVKQFAEADKYVVASPMWNLGVTTILKAYLDYICVVGVTFKYSPKGPVGLLNGKKAVNIVTRGGDYTAPYLAHLEMDDKYVKALFNLFGITDYTTIAANKLDVFGIDAESLVNEAISSAKEVAKNF